MELCAVFVDFTKAFDKVSRNGLWSALKKFSSTEKVTNIIETLYAGMQAKVIVQSREATNEFAVTNGVKQGCVLAPTLFQL